jgi:hypothetical protein
MEADYGTTAFAFDQERGRANTEDDKLIVNFQLMPHPDQEASLKEGRPIFKMKEYVTIMVPGDKNNIVNRPVWKGRDDMRFARQYAAFKNNQSQEADGTPLEQVAWITRNQVEELKHFHVKTLEQLANLADVHAQRFMGINSMRTRARDQIAAAKEQAPLAQLRAEVTKREDQIKQQNELIAKLEARLVKLEEEE